MPEAKQPFEGSNSESLVAVLSTFVIPYTLALLLAALWTRYAELPSLFRLPALPQSLIVWSASGLFFGFLVVAICRFIEPVDWYQGMAQRLQQMLRQAFGRRISRFDAMVVAAFSSLGEEALFRGALQSWLVKLGQSTLGLPPGPAIATAITLTALLFGIVHAPVVRELRVWTAMAIFMGLCFGTITWASGFLLPAVLAHFVINSLNLRRVGEMRFES